MTDAVTTAAIATGGTIAVAIIGGAFGLAQLRKRNTETAPDSQPSTLPTKTVEPPVNDSGTVVVEPSKASFYGVGVRWGLALSSVHHDPEDASIIGNITEECDKHCLVFCGTTVDNIADFMTAREGWTFIVEGTIERVSEYEATLRECKFSDIRPVDPSSGSGGNPSVN